MKYEDAQMIKEFVGKLHYFKPIKSLIVEKGTTLPDNDRYYTLMFRFAGCDLQEASRLYGLLARISECSSHFTTVVYRDTHEPGYLAVVVECI